MLDARAAKYITIIEVINERWTLKEFKDLALDQSLPTTVVNIEDKSRSNLFTWRGQFSPQLIEQILINYADKNYSVFDPFLGSGTVLYECALLGMKASGTEINPAAIAFASIYELANISKNERMGAIEKIESFVSEYINDLPLFDCKPIEDFEQELINYYEKCDEGIERKVLFALITGLDFEAKKIDVKRINNVWGTLRANVENIPLSKKKIKCYQADARKTPVKENSVDFVVTSPPYINVFNYHQNYRKSVEKTGVDVLSVAKSEIGANRKFRQNRFLTVVQYCMDLAEVFIELQRVCRSTAKIFFIVGRESNVRRTAFKNAMLISSVARQCGFGLVGEQERVFTNKFGESIYEEILRFEILNREFDDPIESAREVGRDALMRSLEYCTPDVKDEILEALDKSQTITTSPFLGK